MTSKLTSTMGKLLKNPKKFAEVVRLQAERDRAANQARAAGVDERFFILLEAESYRAKVGLTGTLGPRELLRVALATAD